MTPRCCQRSTVRTEVPKRAATSFLEMNASLGSGPRTCGRGTRCSAGRVLFFFSFRFDFILLLLVVLRSACAGCGSRAREWYTPGFCVPCAERSGLSCPVASCRSVSVTDRQNCWYFLLTGFDFSKERPLRFGKR